MAKHNILGNSGEDSACEYLKRKGYGIIERNWRIGHKEIDLIARDGDELVIVEVKTRSGLRFGNPQDAVTDRKIMKIVSAAHAYVRYRRIDLPIRFDIISIVNDGCQETIEHIERAFIPPLWNR